MTDLLRTQLQLQAELQLRLEAGHQAQTELQQRLDEGHQVQTALQHRIDELEARPLASNVPAVSTTNNTTTNNTTTNNNVQNNINNNNNNTTIIINDFGKEDTSHIPREVLQRRYLARLTGVLATAKDLHFNKDVPHNQNVRLRSRKHDLAERLVNGAWVAEPIAKVADEMLFNSYNLNTRAYHDDPAFQERCRADPTYDEFANIQWMNDMMNMKTLAPGCRRDALQRTRQEVRALVKGLPLPLPLP